MGNTGFLGERELPLVEEIPTSAQWTEPLSASIELHPINFRPVLPYFSLYYPIRTLGKKSCKIPYREEIKWTWVKPRVGTKKIMQWVPSKKHTKLPNISWLTKGPKRHKIKACSQLTTCDSQKKWGASGSESPSYNTLPSWYHVKATTERQKLRGAGLACFWMCFTSDIASNQRRKEMKVWFTRRRLMRGTNG